MSSTNVVGHGGQGSPALASPGAARTEPPLSLKGPMDLALSILDDRFKILIVWHLFWGGRPFCELMRQLEGISKKTLRRELAQMERYGLVRKVVRSGSNRRADYVLTPFGETLKPTVGSMYEWGLRLLRTPLVERTMSLGAEPLAS